MTERPRETDPVPEEKAPKGWFARFLASVEWLGNCLPHPVSLFALFALGVVLISWIAAWAGLSVEDPRAEGEMLTVTNLLTRDGIAWISTNLVTNFTGFVPLGTVLVALLGVGVAEKSGLITAVIRALVLKAPAKLVTVVVVFAGIVSNTASEMGYVVLIPLAMVIFHSLGRHPLAGMACAFAGVSGGYSANLLIGTVDPLLAGITQEAARYVDPAYEVHPAVNWYFMIASTFMVTFLGWFVTEKIVEPRLGPYDESLADETVQAKPELDRVTAREVKGLWAALVSVVVISMGFVVLAGPGWLSFANDLPGFGFLRNPDPEASGAEAFRPMLRSVVTMIFVFFVVPGFVYGRVVGTMKNDEDIIDAMAEAM